MMGFYTADKLATMIKAACKKDVIDLGEDDQQDFYIFGWITLFMFERAKKIRKVETSDALEITQDGYVTFTKNGQEITDMYEPNLMQDASGRTVSIRTSFDSTKAGWFREDGFSPIHVVGLDGLYTLKYLRYSNQVTLGTDVPELHPSMYGECISWVCGKIKLTKNYYSESQAMLQDADAVKLAGVKASISAMGTNAQKPGPDDANLGG